MRARKPKNAKAHREFTRDVALRDGHICRMEVWRNGRWVEHGISGSQMNPIDPSHIYNASQLSEATKFVAVIALHSCRNCHDLYENRSHPAHTTVRVPPAREAAAWLFLNLALGRGLKGLPARRLPPEEPIKRSA